MKITGLRPMMWTEDLKGTTDFYVNVVGFAADEVNEELGWATLSIDDVDALWEKLKDKAGVCYGIEDFYYGMREFAVYDNNGYLLQFGQEIAA